MSQEPEKEWMSQLEVERMLKSVYQLLGQEAAQATFDTFIASRARRVINCEDGKIFGRKTPSDTKTPPRP